MPIAMIDMEFTKEEAQFSLSKAQALVFMAALATAIMEETAECYEAMHEEEHEEKLQNQSTIEL